MHRRSAWNSCCTAVSKRLKPPLSILGLTRIHGHLMYCGHRSQLRHAHFPPSGEVALLDPDPKVVDLIRILGHLRRLAESYCLCLLGVELLACCLLVVPLWEELVLPRLWLKHPPGEWLLLLQRANGRCVRSKLVSMSGKLEVIPRISRDVEHLQNRWRAVV